MMVGYWQMPEKTEKKLTDGSDFKKPKPAGFRGDPPRELKTGKMLRKEIRSRCW